jgi:deazaflavin-dependent oxidoreductase (nitroreductase family)
MAKSLIAFQVCRPAAAYDGRMRPGLKDGVLHARSVLHRAVFALSGGRLLATWGGLPVVMLTTVGWRTGKRRTTIVVAPLTVGESVVLVASDGGAPRHPRWYLNLSASPDVEVLFMGRRMHMRARTAGEGEKATLWPRITAGSPSYGRYQNRTARDIPVVLLEPAEGAEET